MNHKLLVAVVLLSMVTLMGAGRVGRTAATPDSATVIRGDAITVDVLANDGHLGPDLRLHSVHYTGPRGTASMVDNQVRFTAHPGAATGDAVVNYVVRTQNDRYHTGRLTVDVAAATLTLQGRIPFAAPGCSVAVVVGEARYPGCVVDGGFSIAVPLELVDTVATIEAEMDSTFVAGGPPQRFASVLRPLDDLAGRALALGTPGLLSSDDFGPLNVTEYTTAHHTLLVNRHGPGVFDGIEAVAAADRFVDVGRVQQFAVVFRATRRGWAELPAGVPDTVALAADLQSFNTFYQTWTVDPAVVSEDLLLVGSPDHAWPSGLERDVLLTGFQSAPGTINTGSSQIPQTILDGANEARVYESSATAGNAASWAPADGRLLFDPEYGRFSFFQRFINCPTGAQNFYFSFESRLVELARVVQGAGADVSVATIVREVTNGDSLPPGCTSPWPEVEFFYRERQVVTQRHMQPLGTPDTLGAWAVPLPGVASDSIDETAGNAGILDFASLTLDAPGFLPDVTAVANDFGGIDLDLQAVASEGSRPIEMQLFRIRKDGRGGVLWSANADNPQLGSVGLGGLGAPLTHPELFADPANAEGVWRWGNGIGTEGLAGVQQRDEFIEILPGEPREGLRHVFPFATSAFTRPFEWEIDAEGRLVMTTWRGVSDGRSYARCPPELECYRLLVTTLQPVSVSEGPGAKRLYVIEETFVALGGPDGGLFLTRRYINFYDSAQLPEPLLGQLEPAPAPIRRTGSNAYNERR